MTASASKSKGGGTILLVLLVLVSIAGASAFFIHHILMAEDAPPVTLEQPQETGNGEDLGPPVVLSSKESGQEDASSASGALLPPGQFVAPPADDGTQTASDAMPLSPEAPGQTVDSFLGVQSSEESPTGQATGPPAAEETPPGEEDEGDLALDGPAEPAPNLLLVPGAIEPPPPAAREDAVVRPAFVDDIASFLAQNYWPKNTHPSARQSGITTASLQWANLRYGADLRGLNERRGDARGARRAILTYVLEPAAVGRIYGLYADGFVAALKQEADKRVVGEGDGKRPLSEPEKKEMFSIYSGFAAQIADALENYAADPSMPAKVQAYAQSEAAVQEANRTYIESMAACEEAAASEDKSQIMTAQLRMDKDAATYQKRIRERESARNALVAGMSKNKPGSGDDARVYVAFWAYRRGMDSASSLRACSKSLSDMSAKLAAIARK